MLTALIIVTVMGTAFIASGIYGMECFMLKSRCTFGAIAICLR